MTLCSANESVDNEISIGNMSEGKLLSTLGKSFRGPRCLHDICYFSRCKCAAMTKAHPPCHCIPDPGLVDRRMAHRLAG